MHDPASKSGQDRELIAFLLGEQYFCIDIMGVREIRGWTPATPLPQSPAYVRGVINLRGAVLPTIDLALRLGFPPCEPSERSVIIVAQVGPRLVGLLVDAVSDILTAADSSIQSTPDVASTSVRAFVRGLLAVDGRMISMIALENLLPEAELEAA